MAAGSNCGTRRPLDSFVHSLALLNVSSQPLTDSFTQVSFLLVLQNRYINHCSADVDFHFHFYFDDNASHFNDLDAYVDHNRHHCVRFVQELVRRDLARTKGVSSVDLLLASVYLLRRR